MKNNEYSSGSNFKIKLIIDTKFVLQMRLDYKIYQMKNEIVL